MIDDTDIETSTRCGCGTFVVVGPSRGGGPSYGMWQAVCRDCYGPVEDSSAAEMILGTGKTAQLALWDWQAQHDEVHEVEWVLADLFGEIARQVSEELERQRGWVKECAGTGDPPEQCPVGGELVCGPRASLAAAATEYAAL